MVQLSAFPKCWLEELSDGRMSLRQWIDLSVQLQCQGLEFYSYFYDLRNGSDLKEIKSYVEDKGMVIPMMCHSADFTHPDPNERHNQIDEQKEAIRMTAELGGTYTRVLSGQKYPGLSTEEGIKRVVDSIEQCLEEAKAHNVVLVMENHYKDGFWRYSEFAQRIDIFTAIVNQIDSPWFGVQYDPSNTIIANEDPLLLLDLVAEKVRTMHASDRYILDGYDMQEVLESSGKVGYHPALLHGVIGRGLNDYDAIFKRLKQVGFDGWISIEDGMTGMDDMKLSSDYLRMMIAKYF